MLNAWRPDCNKDGWKVGQLKVEYDSLNTPIFDVQALEKLTEEPTPPERLLWPNRNGAKPVYMFGDASGVGFGSSFWSLGATLIQVEHGTWDATVLEDSSSNFRKLGNIVFTLEHMDA
ncbi:hypothetical protein ACA910_008797 [Epithemia clementina (nom. ined.)]